MDPSRTQAEWQAIFKDARKDATVEPTGSTISERPSLSEVSTLREKIDHTLLKLDASEPQIDALCDEAILYAFKSVCVRLSWVSRAVQKLRGTSVTVACVVGFHEGTYAPEEKAVEARDARRAGAMEVDMVINHVLLREQRYQDVFEDVLAVREAAPRPVILKVILETSVLSSEEIVAGCKIAEAAQADFVKTSTGFDGPGATVSNVRLMKNVVKDHLEVKASGGIRTLDECLAMIEAGATRIGASSGVNIIKEAEERSAGLSSTSNGKLKDNESSY